MHQNIQEVKITPDGMDYYSILAGIRNNRKRFGPIRIISIQRSGWEGRYECFMEMGGNTFGVADPVILDKQIEHFLLFAERIAKKIINVLLEIKEKPWLYK